MQLSSWIFFDQNWTEGVDLVEAFEGCVPEVHCVEEAKYSPEHRNQQQARDYELQLDRVAHLWVQQEQWMDSHSAEKS